METSTLIALSRQGGLRRQMDIVANNLANMNTSGFKGEKMMFVEHLVRSRGDDGQVRTKLAFARDIATFRDVTEGPLEKTGNPLDMAVSGEGFFVIKGEQGNSYTRNGRFKLDDGGQLVNQSGQPVLSNAGQPFFFAPEDTDISVAKDGTISTVNGELGKLSIVKFERPQALKPNAAGQFTTRELPTDIEAPNVAQGVLEGSNVLPIIEMASMIQVHRTYEGVKNFIEKEDDRIKQMIRGMGEAA